MKCFSSKLGQKLRSLSGDGKLTYGLFSIIAICLIMLLLLEFMNLISTVRTVEKGIDHAVLSTAADNALHAYGGVREGNASVYEYENGSAPAMTYISFLRTDDLIAKLTDPTGMGLEYMDGTLVKKDTDGNIIFSISDLHVDGENPSPDSDIGEHAVFHTDCRLFIPFYFLKMKIGPTVRITISSRFIPKF